MNIPKIVLTGGPCAGKSSGLSFLYKRLESSGMRPILVPETATLTILAGINSKIIPLLDFQTGLVQLQIQLEDYFERLAQSLPPSCKPVLICDRGAPDGRAFCPKPIWNKVLKRLNTNDVSLRDARYKAVFHMVTAAKGALSAYTLDNNLARTETPAQARRQDKRLIAAWLAHPHHRIINNKEDFASKINEVGKLALEVLGLPEPIESERKFLLPTNAAERLKASRIPFAKVDIEQIYLLSPEGEERRVRKRSQTGFSSHFYCTKLPLSHGRRIEKEEIISPHDFYTLLQQRDPRKRTIHKSRYCFFYKDQFQELDCYTNPRQKFATLEIETEGEVHIPPCFKKAKEVTGDNAYSNNALAQNVESP